MDSSNTVPEESPAEAARAGYVALVGLPNAGKSSLANALVGQKLSIVTSLAQTTRERVVVIDTRDGVQMVFLDTPGLVNPRYLLHHSMLQTALAAVPEADVVLFVVDATAPLPRLSDEAMAALRSRSRALVVAANKLDVATNAEVQRAQSFGSELSAAKVVPVSAVTGEGIEALRKILAAMLPVSPPFYPEDEISAQPVRFFVAELVRETAFELYKEEIPYSFAVRVDEFVEKADPLLIRATIYVERPSQKAIVIGSGGAAIRQLGQKARQKIEQFLDAHVYLDLWVKVLPHWRRDPAALRRLGYPVPNPEK